MVLHSLSGAVEYLKGPSEASERGSEVEAKESEQCPTCQHCLLGDRVTPLPSEELKRRSSGHNAYSSVTFVRQSIRIARSRHNSDKVMGDQATRDRAESPRLVTGSSNIVSSDDMLAVGGKDGEVHLPRTLSTSVLRIKQRRSFWEKFVKPGSCQHCH